MGLFEHWPYTNFHDLNLDWIIKKLPEVFTASAQAVQSAETAVSAKDDAVAAKEAAQSSAENAALSEENAERSAGSAQDYAEHIADPVSGLVTTWLDDNIEPTTPPVDSSLTVQGAAADAKATGDAIDDLRVMISQGGLKDEVKEALLDVLNVCVANDPDSAQLMTNLENALYETSVISISAVFNQGTDIIWTCDNINTLKNYLTVTANYDNGTSGEVTAYTLSGSLTAGTSTITVEYRGATTTFNVNVLEGVDVTPALNSFVAGGNSAISTTSNSIRVYNNANATYTNAHAPVTVKKDYHYYVTCEVDYVSGDDRIGFRDVGQGGATGTSVGMKTLNKVDESVAWDTVPSSYQTWSDSTSPSNTEFFIFSTYATSERGDCTISNLRIIEHQENLGG